MPKIEHFDELNETGKWLVCHLLACIPDEAMWAEETPNIEIRINGYLIEGLDDFFEDTGLAIDATIAKEAARLADLKTEEILGSLSDVIYGVKQELTQWFDATISGGDGD